jgi:putative DNA primase/helicase
MEDDKPTAEPDATASERRVREAQDDPHRLAQMYLRVRGFQSITGFCLRYWRDDWWEWNGRRYRRVQESDLRSGITREVKSELDRWAEEASKASTDDGKTITVCKVSASLIGNVMLAIKGKVVISADREMPVWIGTSRGRASLVAVSNGLVDLDRLASGEPDVLRQHSADWFSTICLDYPYDPVAPCPQWLQFLDCIFEGDQERVDLVQEIFGYFLTPDTSYQKFFVAHGEGANGKQVFAEVLTGMLGEENVSAVPLELFGERFHLTMTLGKLANVATEIGEIDRAAEGLLKAFTAGDRMYFDRKNRPGIEARPTARLFFATNNLPRFRDRSRGVLRRMIILPFRVEVPIEKQDRGLARKLLQERPGIFNWSITGLRRLHANGRFTLPHICQQALDDYLIEISPARAILRDLIQVSPQGHIECGRLYSDYRYLAEGSGYRPVNEREFGKEVKREFPMVRREKKPGGRSDSRPWTYFGICLKDEPVARPQPVVIGKKS